MVFSSLIFLFIFLPVVLIIYYLLNKSLKNIFLTISSLFFYAWGEQKLVMLMIFSIIINYLGGILIERSVLKNRIKLSKAHLALFIGINLLLLGYFKYFNFFIDTLQGFNVITSVKIEQILLPIGISFFTFQGLSYLIDVYYQRTNAQKNLISLGLYISMFPQLVAGPIVRYIDVSKQIKENRDFDLVKFQVGIKRFIVGLFKKVIIANQMAVVADAAFNNSQDIGSLALWLGIICYTFQIYYDFSGYSDMAIGLGKMFGFDFLENFDHPYVSKSIQEFWRRWHISLSSWFRDYLYIPLGGNRKGLSRTYVNLSIVFLLTGLWHGASWNFIVWGLFHGMFLIIERMGLNSKLNKLPSIVGHTYTLVVVVIGWVFFKAETLNKAVLYLKGMFSIKFSNNEYIFQYMDPYFIFVIMLAIIFSTKLKFHLSRLIFSGRLNFFKKLLDNPIYIILLVISLMELAQSNYNPFIYFRF
tara:strand:+ start:20173 stop:21588 length:1416 start_codon:yes stop_codon:yes gene_type:complete